MIAPGQVINPSGRNGKDGVSKQLIAALKRAARGKDKGKSVFGEYARLFWSSDKWKLTLLPYIVPRLRSLEVSGEIQVPFQFIIEDVNGEPVPLPPPVKQISSNVVANTIKLDKCSGITKKVKARRKPVTRKQVKRAKSK